jgi:hypothetical protein
MEADILDGVSVPNEVTLGLDLYVGEFLCVVYSIELSFIEKNSVRREICLVILDIPN